MVIVSSENDPAGMGFGEKNLPTLAPGRLVNVAEVGSTLVTSWSVVTAPAGIVFVRFPLTVIVALSVRVQRPKGGKLPPLKEKVFAPGVALIVPPHVPTFGLTGLYRIILLGIVSVNAIPVSAPVPGLINSILMVEEAPPVTINGSKSLTKEIDTVDPPVTVKLAVSELVGIRF